MEHLLSEQASSLQFDVKSLRNRICQSSCFGPECDLYTGKEGKDIAQCSLTPVLDGLSTLARHTAEYERRLRTCPFCGGDARPEWVDGFWTIHCSYCHQYWGQFRTEADAVEAWNVRRDF